MRKEKILILTKAKNNNLLMYLPILQKYIAVSRFKTYVEGPSTFYIKFVFHQIFCCNFVDL